MGILDSDKVAFAPEQLNEESVEALSSIATKLGATVTEPEEATVLITNPGSPAYKPLTGSAPSSSSSHPATQVPYNWLAACRAAETRIDPASRSIPHPFLQHTTPTKAGVPVRVWVSVNILRRPSTADARANQLSVENELACGGAIIVPKRSQADILIVDRKTTFYQNTIRQEMKQHGRDWQRVAEREWVDACVQNKRFLSVTSGDVKAEDDDESDELDDSFADDHNVAAAHRGPGRPVGKPRIEYTPQDDDFLCRYLAYHYPGGSWGSRKTYEVMHASQNKYPIADRHSPQSWHERFKKNAVPFRRRVEGFVAAKIDEGLRTAKERERRAEREEKNKEATALDKGKSKTTNVASDVVSPSKKPPAAAAAPKRKLVDMSDSDSDSSPLSPQNERQKKKGPSVAWSLGRSDRFGGAPASPKSKKKRSPKAPERDDDVPETTFDAGDAMAAVEAQPPIDDVLVAETVLPAPAPEPALAESETVVRSHSHVIESIQVSQVTISTENGNGTQVDTTSVAIEANDTVPALPQPPLHRKTVADEIAYTSYRRRSSASSAHPRRQSTEKAKDTVNASATVPLTPVAPSGAALPPVPPSPPTPAATPLTPQQWQERVVTGQDRAQAMREAYRQRIAEYSQKYDLAPNELFEIVSAIPKKTGRCFWDDVENGLKEKFGF